MEKSYELYDGGREVPKVTVPGTKSGKNSCSFSCLSDI